MALYVRKGTRIVGSGAAHSWWLSELHVLRSWKTSSAVLLLSFASLQSSRAQVPHAKQTEINHIVRAKGTYIPREGVFKIALPRTDALVVQDYQRMPTTLGLNTWAAFSPAVRHEALLTGELLIREDEVDRVLGTVLNTGLSATGLADSSFFEGPRIKTLNISGSGSYQSLAQAFRAALNEIDKIRREDAIRPRPARPPTISLDSAISPAPIDAILSMRGTVSDGIYRAAIGRQGIVNGEAVGREMGLTTWVSFSGTDNHALAQGEMVATADELQPVLRALRSRDISIVSIRNHVTGEHPKYYFIRFWQEGRVIELAHSLRYALDVQVGSGKLQSIDHTP